MSLKFDVIILGGGPAGASAAISLLHKGYSVAIIEKTSYSEIRIGETVPPQIIHLLDELKINNQVLRHHLPSYANQSAWGNSSLKENNFFFNPFGNGWHLDRLKFDMQLVDFAIKNGATVFKNSKVKGIEQFYPDYWKVQFCNANDKKLIHARFMIDATGRNAFLAKKQGSKRISVDHLIGITTILNTSKKYNQSNYTLVESVNSGWWYSADLPGNKMIIAFMTDADLCKKKNYNDEDSFKKLLSKTKFTKDRCVNSPCEIKVYAANSYIMTKRYGNNWIAIGDAAMAYDPLSSTGIIKGIKDGCNSATEIHNFFSGRKRDFKEFGISFQERFKNYLSHKKEYYLLEKRWKDDTFWKRRHEPFYASSS